jgi:DNA mismatch repair protein MutH
MALFQASEGLRQHLRAEVEEDMGKVVGGKVGGLLSRQSSPMSVKLRAANHGIICHGTGIAPARSLDSFLHVCYCRLGYISAREIEAGSVIRRQLGHDMRRDNA